MQVCDHFRAYIRGGRPRKVIKQFGRPLHATPIKLPLEHIQCLTPYTDSTRIGTQLATGQSQSALDKLKCSICCGILNRPIQLPCEAIACTDCLARHLVQNGGLECPCKYCNTSLTVTSVKRAPGIYFSLLDDILLHCRSCNGDIRAGSYRSHNCSTTTGGNRTLQITQSVLSSPLSPQ